MSLFDRILNAGYNISMGKEKELYMVMITKVKRGIICEYFGLTIEEATKLCVEELGV